MEGWVYGVPYNAPLTVPLAVLLVIALGLLALVLAVVRAVIAATVGVFESTAGARGAFAIPLAFPVFAGLVFLPYFGWAEGFPDSFVTACWLAAVGAAAGCAASVALGTWLARRTPRWWGRTPAVSSPPEPQPSSPAAPPGSGSTAGGSDRGTE